MLGSASDLNPCGLVQVSRCIEAYLEALRENGLKPVPGENKENAMHRPCKILEGLSPPSRYCAYRRPRAFAAATPFLYYETGKCPHSDHTFSHAFVPLSRARIMPK